MQVKLRKKKNNKLIYFLFFSLFTDFLKDTHLWKQGLFKLQEKKVRKSVWKFFENIRLQIIDNPISYRM